MPYSYLSLTQLKATGGLNFTGTVYDSRLLVILEAVSREVDAFTQRAFAPMTDTRDFDGPGSRTLHVPDLIAVGTLLEDTNLDGTYETTWASTDYDLWPYNASPTADWGQPYSQIQVNTRSNGTQDVFLKGHRNYRIAAGTWGWRNTTTSLSETGTLANATSTVLIVASSSTLEVGQTLLIDSEWVYVTSTGTAATATATGTITVTRGVQGSPATAHTAAAISAVTYPREIGESVLIQASRLLKRRESGFASSIGFPETGQMVVYKGGLDPDVQQLLSRFRRMTV